MLMIRARAPAQAVPADCVELPFDLRQRSRLLTRLRSGEEVGLMLDRGTVLRGGDLLLADDGRVVAVVAAAETLMEVRCDDADQLARCAFHLGNRHTPVEVLRGALRIAADEVLAGMLRGLKAQVTTIESAFEPEAGAYAAAHHHHSGDAKHNGIIHDMIERVRSRA